MAMVDAERNQLAGNIEVDEKPSSVVLNGAANEAVARLKVL